MVYLLSMPSKEKEGKESEELLIEDDLTSPCYLCDKQLTHDDKGIKCHHCNNKAHVKCLCDKLNCDEDKIGDVMCQQCQEKQQKPSQPGAKIIINIPKKGKKSFSGPVKERKCTDIFFVYLKIALAFLVMILMVMYWRNSYMIFPGVDSCGNVCGSQNLNWVPQNNPQCKPKNYFFERFVLFKDTISDITDLGLSRRECVGACPDNSVRIMQFCLKLGNRTVIQQGDDSMSKQDMKYNDKPQDYDIFDFDFYQYIINDSLDNKINGLINSSSVPMGERFLQLLALSFGISFIFILMVSFVTRFFVWAIFANLYVVLIVVTLFLGTLTLNELMTINDGNGEYCLKLFEKMFLTIVTFIMFMSMVIGVCKMNPFSSRSAPLKKRINMIASLYNQAGNVIGSVPSIMFLPILTVIFIGVSGVSLIRRTIMIETMGLEDEKGQLHITNAQWMVRLVSLICGLWGIQFVINCQNMVIAGAVSQWYFTRDKTQVKWPVMSSIWRLARYHLGTVLFGSLITYPLALIFYCIKNLFKCNSMQKLDIQKVFFLLIMSLLKLMDSFQIMFDMTCNQAYVQTSIYGQGLFKSYSKALNLQCKHLRNSIHVNLFGVVFVVLSKLIIIGFIVALAMWGFQQTPSEVRSSVYDLRMTLVILVGYFVAHLCTSVFQAVAEAIYICFLEDCNNNDGTKSYYMNPQLEEFIVKDNNEGGSIQNRPYRYKLIVTRTRSNNNNHSTLNNPLNNNQPQPNKY